MPPSPTPRSSTAATPPTSRTSMPATRADPNAVDAEWRAFFQSLKDDAGDVPRDRARAVLEAAGLAAAGARRAGRGARRRLGRGSRRRVGDKVKAKAQAKGVGALAGRGAAGDARFGARPDADPRLPHPRPPARQSRSARPRAAEGPRGARSALLRLHRGRLRPPDLPRPRARARIRHAARDRRDPASAPTARRSASSSCTSPIRRRRRWLQERIEGPDKEITFTREGKRAILNKLVEAEGLRAVLRPEVHRHQALRPRRRRVDDPGARADHQARRRARREGDRARHGASRPPQRAGPGDGQAAPRDLPRIQGRLVDARTRSRARAT